MYQKTKTPPVMSPAEKTAIRQYERPAFTVIPLNVEAPLLSGSSTPNGVLNNLPYKDE